jgi:transposase
MFRKLRDQRAVGRYGGLTGSPDESGTKRREKGLARAGNARVRCGTADPMLKAPKIRSNILVIRGIDITSLCRITLGPLRLRSR